MYNELLKYRTNLSEKLCSYNNEIMHFVKFENEIWPLLFSKGLLDCNFYGTKPLKKNSPLIVNDVDNNIIFEILHFSEYLKFLIYWDERY